MISALDPTGRRIVANLNSIIVEHVNQSSMNPFLSTHIDKDLMFRRISKP